MIILSSKISNRWNSRPKIAKYFLSVILVDAKNQAKYNPIVLSIVIAIAIVIAIVIVNTIYRYRYMAYILILHLEILID